MTDEQFAQLKDAASLQVSDCLYCRGTGLQGGELCPSCDDLPLGEAYRGKVLWPTRCVPVELLSAVEKEITRLRYTLAHHDFEIAELKRKLALHVGFLQSASCGESMEAFEEYCSYEAVLTAHPEYSPEWIQAYAQKEGYRFFARDGEFIPLDDSKELFAMISDFVMSHPDANDDKERILMIHLKYDRPLSRPVI